MLAEFMGVNNPFPEYPKVFIVDDEKTYLKYHNSWDWLMPVIEKIGDTRIYSDRGYKVEIVNGYTKIEGTGGRIFYNSSVEGGMLNATYKACVQFVGWLKLRQKGGYGEVDKR